jgi:hypothetical protein
VSQRIVDAASERISETVCPFCRADDWAGGRLVGVPITDLTLDPKPEEVKVTTLAVVLWICGNCGFIRSHSIAPDLFA